MSLFRAIKDGEGRHFVIASDDHNLDLKFVSNIGSLPPTGLKGTRWYEPISWLKENDIDFWFTFGTYALADDDQKTDTRYSICIPDDADLAMFMLKWR